VSPGYNLNVGGETPQSTRKGVIMEAGSENDAKLRNELLGLNCLWELEHKILLEPNYQSATERAYFATAIRLILEERVFGYLEEDPLVGFGDAKVIKKSRVKGAEMDKFIAPNAFRLPPSESRDEWFESVGVDNLKESPNGRGIYFHLGEDISSPMSYISRAWGVSQSQTLIIWEFHIIPDGPKPGRIIKIVSRGTTWEELFNLAITDTVPVEYMLESLFGYLDGLTRRRERLWSLAKERSRGAERLSSLLLRKRQATAWQAEKNSE